MGMISLGAMSTRRAELEPEAVAIHMLNESITWQELEWRSNQLARVLGEMGVGPGKFVSLVLENSINFYVATLATWKLGATPNPIDPRASSDEQRAMVDTANAAVVVGADIGRPFLPVDFVPDGDVPGHRVEDVAPKDWKALLSSGTTGAPKLVVSRGGGLIDPDVASRPSVLSGPGTHLVTGSLSQNSYFTLSTLALLYGNRVLVMPRFDAGHALRLIEDFSVSWTVLVPSMMEAIWRHPERQRCDVSSLQRVVHLCAACPAPIKAAWMRWLSPEKVWEVFGATEGQAFTLITGAEWLVHPGSVGRATGAARIRILSPDGTECSAGESGEIFMMPPGGPGSTYYYLGGPSPRRTDDGWESLGDLGWVDDDGYLYVEGRRPRDLPMMHAVGANCDGCQKVCAGW